MKWPCLASRSRELSQEELEEEPLVPDQRPQLRVLTTEGRLEAGCKLKNSSAEGVFPC